MNLTHDLRKFKIKNKKERKKKKKKEKKLMNINATVNLTLSKHDSERTAQILSFSFAVFFDKLFTVNFIHYFIHAFSILILFSLRVRV